MYIWSTRSLVSDLRRGVLPQHEQLKYLLVWAVVSLVLYEIPTSVHEPYSLERGVMFIGSIVVSVLGTISAYRANKGSNGNDFLGRYISLSLPIMVRIFALVVPVIFLYLGFTEYVLRIDATSLTTWVDVVAILGFEILFFSRLVTRIGEIAEV